MTVVESVNGKTGVVKLGAAEVEAIPASEAGQPSGVATLNGSGALPEAQLPSSVVNSRADIEALLTGGEKNTFLGAHAFKTGEGEENTAIGYHTLEDNTTGKHNTAIGADVLSVNTTGNYNVGVGNALSANTTGSENTAIGTGAMLKSISGSRNVAVGRESLGELRTGTHNTAVGTSALAEVRTGGQNVAVGVACLAGAVETAGSEAMENNTAIGYQAGIHAEGNGNVFLGCEAGANETGSDKLYISNSGTAKPLILGDFSAKVVTIEGKAHITEVEAAPTAGAEGTVVVGESSVSRKVTGIIKSNGVTTKYILKHTLKTSLIVVGFQGKGPGEIEALGATKVKALSNTEVEILFSVAPAKGEAVYVTIIG